MGSCTATSGLMMGAVLLAALVGSCTLFESPSTRAGVGPTGADHRPAPRSPSTPQTRLSGLHEIAPGVLIGGAPRSPHHFDELARLGVRTVLAVDATTPDLDQLRARGIASVHVPIGYSGVSEEQRLSLTKALATAERPIYIHCHHGKHRGPAAACIGLLATGEIDQARAEEVLEQAGTSPSYPGLFEAVGETTEHPSPGTIQAELHERAPVGAMADTMARIDQAMDSLLLIRSNGWEVPRSHPDLAPAALAGQIERAMSALLEHEAVKDRPHPFAQMLDVSSDLSGQLENSVLSKDYVQAGRALSGLNATCIQCHSQFRD